jgi:hypothetical protein
VAELTRDLEGTERDSEAGEVCELAPAVDRAGAMA